MEKKELLIETAYAPQNFRINLLARIGSQAWLRRLAAVYSFLLEEEVGPRRTLRLLHAQVAVLSAVLPADMPLALRALLLAWAFLACRQCRTRQNDNRISL